jgi:hypothetical protein
LRPASDEALFEQFSPQHPTGRWVVAILLITAVVVAAYVVWVRVPEQATISRTPAPVRATESVRPLGGEAAPIALPPLSESDAVVADLVRALSTHPQISAWLTTDGLIRNFTVVVSNIAEGKTAAKLLSPLRPLTPFRVVERSADIYIDARSYNRYTPLAEAAASIDAAGSASLYATLKPRIEEAHRELGELTPFDRTLERAVVVLLETPIRQDPIRLQPRGGIGYAFADPGIEGMTPAQKQLLRMGPENTRIIQTKLREIALALGIPPQRLPR